MYGSSLLISPFCIAAIVIGALVALAVILLKPKGGKPKKAQSAPSDNTRPKRMSWILYIGISLLIAIWTVWGALFFLAVVGLLHLNPKPYQKEIPYPSDLDKDSAKGIYTWLLLSPFLTVPTMLIAAFSLDWNSSPNERVLAALIPLVFHLPMLFKLNTKSAFVYRHTQQAIFLVALRAGMASIALSIGEYPGEGAWLFLLGNGALWLFGSFWGSNQAARRECWWITRQGQTILLKEQPVRGPEVKWDMKSSPETQDNADAIEYALIAFRSGIPESKRNAIKILSHLGEVETF